MVNCGGYFIIIASPSYKTLFYLLQTTILTLTKVPLGT